MRSWARRITRDAREWEDLPRDAATRSVAPWYEPHVARELEGVRSGIRLAPEDVQEALRLAFSAVLIKASLEKAIMARSNLTDADLRGAHMKEANLQDATLPRAKLTKADATAVDFSTADLQEADLAGAVIEGCLLYTSDAADE